MSILRALWISRAPAAALMSVGVLWGSFAGMVPDIKARVGASDAELGAALLMSALGGVLAMWGAPWLGTRLGRFTLPAMGVLSAVAVLYPILPTGVVGLGAVLFCMGLTVATLDISANVHISGLESRHGMHLMNVSHAMFSFAFAGAAWGVGLARQAGLGAPDILPPIALASLLLVPLMRVRRAPPAEDAAPEAPRRVPWAAIVLTGLILFCAFIGENATEAWSALHIERTLGAAPGEGSFGPAMLGLLMGFGRLLGQVLTARLGDARLIFGSAILGMIGAVTIAAAPTVAVALVGVAVVGLGMAVIVPSVNSILGAAVSERQRAHAISRAWMLGMIGFFVGPSMMGGISELFGLRVSFVVVAALVSLILPAVWALAWRPSRGARV